MGGEPRRMALRARIGAIADLPPIAEVRAILDDYGAAGNGLLAAGLAFSALFALVPALLLVFGFVGLSFSDAERRAAAIETLALAVPPLRPLLETSVAEIARDARSVSIIGFVGLVWGASRFFVALEEAFARVFRDSPRRGIVQRTLLGMVVVGVLLVAVVAALVVSSIASFLSASLAAQINGSAAFWQVASPGISAVWTSLAIAFMYRFLPPATPPWRALVGPALVVGIVIAVVTELFVFIAPRLVGAAAVYGSLGALFTALAWLSIVFQLLLLGASWTRRRTIAWRTRTGGRGPRC